MGIKFKCGHCHRTLNVKDHLAGKRGICPKCQGKIEIPHASTVADRDGAPAALPPAGPAADIMASVAIRTVPPANTLDPITEAPELNWYVAPPGSMTKYGPAPGDLMRSWIREGRVSGDSLVWREGWSQWRVAAQAFPELTRAAAHAVAPAPAPKPEPSAAPARRVADFEIDEAEGAFDGVLRAPQGIDIGVDDLEEPPQRAPAISLQPDATPQGALPGVLEAFDEEPEPRRATARATKSSSSSSQLSNNAFLISGLLITFIALVVVLIYLLTRQ